MLGLAFLDAPLGPVVCVAFVPLLSALERVRDSSHPIRRAFGLGYAAGFVFYLIGAHWIAMLSDVASTVPWLKYPAWLVAAVYLGLFPAVACAAALGLSRRSGLSLAVTFPPVWVVLEELRASGELGFPWFQPGYALHAYPAILQLASLGSVTLVTWWVLTVNALIWRGRFQPEATTPGLLSGRALARIAAVLAVLLPVLWGLKVLAVPVGDGRQGRAVALVQGNVAGEIKWAGQHQHQILSTFLELSRQAMSGPDSVALVIWPETATGSYLRRQVDQTLEVARLAAQYRVPVFSGYPDYQVDSLGVVRYVNGAGMFYPDGTQSQVYAKRHLVPFGERMPFQRWFPGLGKINLGQAEWRAGDRAVLYPGPAGYFSCLVCFESIFPDLARADVRGGARTLVNITNDEWFGNSAAIEQHAGMAVLRAVENRVPLARCANTGLTMMVDARGRVTRRLPVFSTATLIAPLPPAGPATLYGRWGDWPGIAAFIVLALLALRWRRVAPGAR